MDILIYFDSHLFLWRTFWSWNIFRPESLFRFDLWNLSLLRIKKNFFGDSSTIFVILQYLNMHLFCDLTKPRILEEVKLCLMWLSTHAFSWQRYQPWCKIARDMLNAAAGVAMRYRNSNFSAWGCAGAAAFEANGSYSIHKCTWKSWNDQVIYSDIEKEGQNVMGG